MCAKVFHHVDVYSRHSWRFFEMHSHMQSATNMTELHNVVVIGATSLPDSEGTIHSKVKRLMVGLWMLYQSKLLNTMRADAGRAHPVLVTQDIDDNVGGGGHDDKTTKGAALAAFNQQTPQRREQEPDAKRVHALVAARNQGNHCLANLLQTTDLTLAQAEQQAKREYMGGSKVFEQFELDAGRAFVSTHLPEAPADLLPLRQAFMESVCLAQGVPMSMISSGDASGRAKLNTENASPETAQIFRDAQSDRRKRVASHIASFYQHLYGDSHVEEFVRQEVEKAYAGKKRKKVDIPLKDMARHARVVVSIPGNAEFEKVAFLAAKGFLTHSATCHAFSLHTGMPLEAFKQERSLTDEQKLLEGCAPPKEPAAGGAKKPAKKKAKSK